MYCAVPKIATKTVLSYLIYIYFRELSDHLNSSGTDSHTDRARSDQLVGITKLVKELQKVGRIVRSTILKDFTVLF